MAAEGTNARERSKLETESRDEQGRTRAWLREERRGDEDDEGGDKRCGEKAQKGVKKREVEGGKRAELLSAASCEN